MVYSTYLGGAGPDDGAAIALDLSNNAYLTGITDSDNFPVSAGAFQPTRNGNSDAFITKLNANGTALAYGSYLGGNNTDYGLGVGTDFTGNAYLTGLTASPNFPATTGVLQTALSGASDGFAIKFNPNANGAASVVYATFLGGNSADWGGPLAVDGVGNAYVAGLTNSPNFPATTGAFQPAKAAGSDAFVAKLNTNGTALAYATFVGGSGADYAQSLAVDSAGQAFVAGVTQSANFPTTTGAAQTALAGRADAFALKLRHDGAGLIGSTYLGGAGDDEAFGVSHSIASRTYATGGTNSANFPTATPLQPNAGGQGDAFVTRLRDISTTTPIENNRFFVRQQYLDFLSRDPDTAGWDYWTGELDFCGANAACLRQRRVQVSNAFFFELEFQQTGAYVYRLYKAAYGNAQPFPNPSGDQDANPYCVQFGCPLRAAHIPAYDKFVTDRARVVGGVDLAASQLALANAFAQRAEFITKYPASLAQPERSLWTRYWQR